MRVELLHMDECPNTVEAYERIHQALRVLGRSMVDVHLRVIKTASDTKNTGFAGSPTITLNGNDIFPTGATAGDLACRIYMTPEGFAGLPTVDQLIEALTNNGI